MTEDTDLILLFSSAMLRGADAVVIWIVILLLHPQLTAEHYVNINSDIDWKTDNVVYVLTWNKFSVLTVEFGTLDKQEAH
jgi:hypothetical protein